MSPAMWALISAFGLVLAVELPDKTLVATLVLTTRFRAWPVFAGVCVAFALQCVIAVLFGSFLTLLPESLEGWPARAATDLDDVLPELDVVYLLRIQRERLGSGGQQKERRRSESRAGVVDVSV